jgi:hypothetical protein
MKRVLLISLALMLALAGWSAVGAQDGFYVIPSMKVVPKTGQTATYGPRDDGQLQKGVPSPAPRFTDNGNGTVTDNLTRLIWMQNASDVGAVGFGQKTWDDALTAANSLKSGDAGLTDGSQAGDWRLPNLRELQSLIDYGRSGPALPPDHPFTGVQSAYYWLSTTVADPTTAAWYMSFTSGSLNGGARSNTFYVLCVRGGP